MLSTLLTEKLDTFELSYNLIGNNEIVFKKEVLQNKIEELSEVVKPIEINFIKNQNLKITYPIKSTISDMLTEDNFYTYNTSHYLSEKLDYSYLSNLLKNTTHSSIKSYIILCKVNKAKDLFTTTNQTPTEIAFSRNDSSVAYLSRQF